MWGCTPVIPAPGEGEAGRPKFRASLGNLDSDSKQKELGMNLRARAWVGFRPRTSTENVKEGALRELE